MFVLRPLFLFLCLPGLLAARVFSASGIGLVEGARAQAPVAPVLNGGAKEQTATAGYYTLSWTAVDAASDGATTFELVETGGEDTSPEELLESEWEEVGSEQLVYRGPDLATTMSGKSDGVYTYRIRVSATETSRAGPWSEPHRVVVSHHPIGRAFTFLFIGAFVFVATLSVILYGHSRERREREADWIDAVANTSDEHG